MSPSSAWPHPDGGVFAFGDAAILGSQGGYGDGAPFMGIVATPAGHGYWRPIGHGGINTYGDATYQEDASKIVDCGVCIVPISADLAPAAG